MAGLVSKLLSLDELFKGLRTILRRVKHYAPEFEKR
jgi:hypothetical protein